MSTETTKLGPAAQKIADGLNDVLEGRYHTTIRRRPVASRLCAECRGTAEVKEYPDGGFFVQCGCGAQGAVASTRQHAGLLWSQRQDAYRASRVVSDT